MRFLTLDEIDALWVAAKSPAESACLVLLRLGLRQGEVLAISDLDFVDDCTISVNNTLTQRPNPAYKPGRGNPKDENFLGHTKTVRSRADIHVPKPWMEILKSALEVSVPCAIPDHESKSGEIPLRRFLVTNRFGLLWGEWSASRAMRKMIERANVEMKKGEQTWHCWRHSYASDLVALGIDDIALGQLLRHADPMLTRGTYSHARKEYRDSYAEYGQGIKTLEDYNEALCRFDTDRREKKLLGQWQSPSNKNN
jgi:integrase